MSWTNMGEMPWMELQITLDEWDRKVASGKRHEIYNAPGVNIYSHMLDTLHTCEKGMFLKVKWRKDIGSAVYLLSSVGWRQDHNGYSHQNPKH